jgi:hypothetical protein
MEAVWKQRYFVVKSDISFGGSIIERFSSHSKARPLKSKEMEQMLCLFQQNQYRENYPN